MFGSKHDRHQVFPPPQNLWLLLLVSALVVGPPGVLQKCVFDEVQAQVGVATLKKRSILGELVRRRPSRPQPIRIKTWTPRESDSLSEDERARLQAAVEEAVKTVSSLLSGNVYSEQDCRTTAAQQRCQQILQVPLEELKYQLQQIPDDHLSGCDVYPEADSPLRTVLRSEGTGLPDTDFLLYINSQLTDKCRAEPNVLAYAVHCQTDSLGRPVAGLVTICRDRLTGDTYNHQTTVQTVIHELLHALGFSKDLFNTWRDCSSQGGSLCSPRNKVVHPDGQGQMRIYTPSIISALQEHLGSADPELGGPLENLDASATRVSSHWEARVLQGSIMAAVLGDPTTVRIDSITLAALQDMGWYQVDQSRAQSLVWGDGGGATFGSLSTCKDNSSSFFCTGSGVGCHYLQLHKGECQTDPYLEGCRIYKPLRNGSECWKQENIKWSDVENRSGEIFVSDSRCFFSSLLRQADFNQTGSSVEGRCYRHRCTGPNRYQIQVSGSGWVDCPAGRAVQIKGYQGSVSCPDRRLCLHPDVTSPLDESSPHPACVTCDPSAQSRTWTLLGSPLKAAVATSLSFTAAGCFLTTLMVSYRKWRRCVIRIQAVAPEDHQL
ncbi:ciliated left-right organizer metallopeptidase [Nothobranchius furzeri]